MWNKELDMIAEEELAEAAALVGRVAAVDYEVARTSSHRRE